MPPILLQIPLHPFVAITSGSGNGLLIASPLVHFLLLPFGKTLGLIADKRASAQPEHLWSLFTVQDQHTGKSYLIDTGATISAVPATIHDKQFSKPGSNLIDSTLISTY